MSEAEFFAAPPFNADQAIQRLRRELREMGLTEREGLFERGGKTVARLVLNEGALVASLVRLPSRSPQWQAPRQLAHAADLRDFSADLKKRLAQWSDRDD